MSPSVSESAQLLACQKLFDEAKQKTGIHERELKVMFDLFENPKSASVDIAERTGFVVPTLSRYLTALRRGGHVKRIVDDEDVRKVMFMLSDTGKLLVGNLLQLLKPDNNG